MEGQQNGTYDFKLELSITYTAGNGLINKFKAIVMIFQSNRSIDSIDILVSSKKQ